MLVTLSLRELRPYQNGAPLQLGRYVSTRFGPVSFAVEMFEPVTITRSTSAVPSAGGSEGSWPNAVDKEKSATQTLAAKAIPTGQRSNVSERF